MVRKEREFERDAIIELMTARIVASIDRPLLLLHLDKQIERFIKNKCSSIAYFAWLLGCIQGYYQGVSSGITIDISIGVDDNLDKLFKTGSARIAVRKLWEVVKG